MVRKKLVKRKKKIMLSDSERKLFWELGERYWAWLCNVADAMHLFRIRQKVNPRGERLRLYYPQSGTDVVSPLLVTDATEFIFVDAGDAQGCFEEKIHNELNSRKWSDCRLEDRETRYVEGGYGGEEREKVKRTEFEFFFNDKPRTIVFYRADPADFFPPELEGEGSKPKGFDVVFFRRKSDIKNREFLWLWEMLKHDGLFVAMGDFNKWKTFFRKADFIEARKSWNYEGSAQLAPYVWTVLSKKRPDSEMSGLVKKSMELARERKISAASR